MPTETKQDIINDLMTGALDRDNRIAELETLLYRTALELSQSASKIWMKLGLGEDGQKLKENGTKEEL